MTPTLKRTIGALLALWMIGTAAALLFWDARRDRPAETSNAPRGKRQVNRALPAFNPPRTAYNLSARPTKEEIFEARAFEEPLVPIGGEPSLEENAELAVALEKYAKRETIDDFSSLTGFLEKHPSSVWVSSLLTSLGTEYYNTAHYSLALDAWSRAWLRTRTATEPHGRAIGDRAGAEYAYLSAKLGRMTELESFFDSTSDRVFRGPASERIAGARMGLEQMIERPETSFRCGPLALSRIILATHPNDKATKKALDRIHESASTQDGVSLSALRALSKAAGMNYQMAFRDSGDFVVPSVIHWKVGHYAAVIRREGEQYLLQDPTFTNDVWATRAALEDETSGYFLIAQQPVPAGWRTVAAEEGDEVFGKGIVQDNCRDECLGPCDPPSGGGGKCQGDVNCRRTAPPRPSPPPGGNPPGGPSPDGSAGPDWSGMTVANVHLNTVNLHMYDHPLQYQPPVGPVVRFSAYYNHRDSMQPATFTYSNLGPKWTSYWTAYILDNPRSPLSDVKYYTMGGGIDLFTGFDAAAQSFAPQPFQQTKLTRTSGDSYRLLHADGSMLLFSQPDYAVGTQRKVFLTRLVDPSGNALTFSYDEHLRLVGVTDAVGQVTVLSYEDSSDPFRITQVTDPFGRFASFDYDGEGRLSRITDVGGIESEFTYEGSSDFINALTTPYGTTTFTRQEGTTRWIESLFPDGNGERVEFNQTVNIANVDPANTVPSGMNVSNVWLSTRNTFYWDKTAFAEGQGDYSKARIYHWLHGSDLVSAAGVIESIKAPLEGRVWFNYPGQTDLNNIGTSSQPANVGRVLDDGATQLHKYEYNALGNVTKTVDPVGRTFSYVYADNGIDLLEVRQTRGTSNELLSSIRYNDAHQPLEVTDAAGQSTRVTYNARGQVLTVTDARGGVTTNHYDTDGYLTSVDGPLPDADDTFVMTYDALGRVDTTTDESGHTLSFDYDVFDRLTETTYPDSTYEERTYTLLDLTQLRDRAGRLTTFEYDPARQRTKTTDPLGRVLRFEPCACGSTKSLTDAMGRTTRWSYDIQGRTTKKTYADGTSTSFRYESRSSRLRERVDAKGQKTLFEYNADNTRRRISYPNALVTTPTVAFKYDQDYPRVVQMTDGIGTSLYSYNPVGAMPRLGANRLARVDGPLPSATVTYDYDELGIVKSVGVNGDARTIERDLAGRVMSETNALGEFTYTYDGASNRLETETYPNGQTVEYGYGTVQQDFDLRRITNEVNGNLLSEFTYDRDVAAGRITTWTQAASGEPTKTYTFGYDATNQLTSATLAVSGQPDEVTTYSYDAAGNRLAELTDGVGASYSYNALNELMSIEGATPPEATYQWDAQDRLIGVTTGATAVSFGYDGRSRLSSVLVAANGTPVEDKRYVWSGDEIATQTDATGLVVRQFYGQGMSIAQGLQAGPYYYARDHLGSIRELVDGVGGMRARYAYSPFGMRTQLTGDVNAEYGFTGLLQQNDALLAFARYRVYDAHVGRWMSRDPLGEWAGTKGLNPLLETWVAPNLFLYVGSDPVNFIDPTGQQAAPIPWGPIFGGAAAGAAVGGAVGALAGAVLVCFFVPGDTPQPDDAECDKQWSDAYKKCAEFITSRQTPEVKRLRGSRHGKPYNLDECARGHVSAACGGNPI